MKNIPYLPDITIKNKRILLRVDLNVPIKNGIIESDFKLQKIVPTLDYILDQNGTIILLTHLGRPTHYDPALSTKQLIPWFTQHGYDVQFAATIDQAATLKSPIILLENLRFFPGEQTDNKNIANEFADQLASLGDVYINDAFGLLHRSDTSIILLPQKFKTNQKACGLLVATELTMLDTIMHTPKHPFVLILGGCKARTKIPIIENLLDTVDTILLCPALAFTFLHAMGKEVGKSLVDTSLKEDCLRILDKAKTKNIAIIFPSDYLVAYESLNGPLSTTSNDRIDTDSIGISIGPKTEKLFDEQIQKAHTLFFNGAIGFTERPETLDGMKSLFQSMGNTHATTFIAGGDSVAAAHLFGIQKQITHLSTGGGSALDYISGQKLPGLNALKNGTKT